MYGEIDWLEIILAQKQTIERLNDKIEMLEAEVNGLAASKADRNDFSVEQIEKAIKNYDLNNNLSFSKIVTIVDELSEIVNYLNGYKWNNIDADIAKLNVRLLNVEKDVKEHRNIISRNQMAKILV